MVMFVMMLLISCTMTLVLEKGADNEWEGTYSRRVEEVITTP